MVVIDRRRMHRMLTKTATRPLRQPRSRPTGPDAEGVEIRVNFVFTDLGESYLIDISNAVLHHRASRPDTPADAVLRITHEMFLDLLTGQGGLKELLLSDDIELEGSKLDLLKFFLCSTNRRAGLRS